MDNASHFHDKTIETVKRNFYVDDCLKSVRDEEEAIKLSKELRELLSLGGFNLTKWLSNSRRVIESLPEAERAAQVKDLDFDKVPIERALGVRWNVSSDTFGFAIVIKDRPATKRGILSIVSSIYDPLGFVAPYILSAKLILQELCRLKLDWDDKIPDENLKHWQAWLHDLPQLENLAVERCFKPATMNDIKSTQLHHFSDASQQGYGAVSYIRIEDISGNVKCSFVMGKSRLAPMKPVTIPRMELSAAVVSTKLDKMSRNELSLPTDQSFFWTDSTCFLRYIENTTKRFQTFVANRIATIHDASTPKQWNYVDTCSNPADDASRGVPADSLLRWIKGSDFLTKPPGEWPKRPEDLGSTTAVLDDDPEVKHGSFVCAASIAHVSKKQFTDQLIERFSSWSRLRRVFALILRYVRNLRSRTRSQQKDRAESLPSANIPPISLTELVNAERAVLKLVHLQLDIFKVKDTTTRLAMLAVLQNWTLS
ncbi:uncharacterized protein LOC114542779 [Dendronephthya gigantea]|uniref:uncharacterized protein LOC114542779 n=1 Tax=Dendronephthya gigantea TaxID=151771 RepID=UPI00106AC5C7|nr:uncharacterized protein LOC114542779 [Dendronephthya gigantea]